MGVRTCLTLAASMFLGAIPAAAAAPAAAPEQISKLHQFRSGVAALRAKYGVPALAVSVHTPAGLAAIEALGVRHVGRPAPVELTDPFHLGSIGKAMTATLAATLVEDGVIRWDSTPARVWPEFAARMDPRQRRLTLSQFLSNAAGVQAYTSNDEIKAEPPLAGSAAQQRAAFARRILARPPRHEVGKMLYSNAGFAIAAAMLERASGRSWEQLVRDRVWRPLGMNSCALGWPSASGSANRSHRLVGAVYREKADDPDETLPAWLAPAGHVHCSITDLGRFGEEHLLGQLERGHLLKPATYLQLRTRPPGYYRGWYHEDFGLLHRGGTTQGWHALLIVSPGSQVSVATAVNAREPGKTDELMTEVTQLAFDLFGSPLSKAPPARR